MRVIVLTTSETYTPAQRLLAALAAGLAARGETTALACLSRGAVETAIETEWPRLSFRAIVGAGFVRRVASVRGILTALRPDAVLVGSEEDASLAAVALGAKGGVVRRLSVTESAHAERGASDEGTWRSRLARSRTRYEAWGTRGLAISWPPPAPPAPIDPAVQPLPVQPANLVIVPAAVHEDETAFALRAASQLRARLPELRITLLGAPEALQATRLHAASLDLTAAVQILPLETLLQHALLPALAVWVCAPGDAGAVATLAAMQQQRPVVVPIGADFAEMVAPGIGGFLVSPEALAPTVAELARLHGDQIAAARMGEAAASRAQRLYGWDAFVDAAAERLVRVSGVTAARITTRPSLTPA
jgi:hypothetical protein